MAPTFLNNLTMNRIMQHSMKNVWMLLCGPQAICSLNYGNLFIKI